jgi:hypothetical protein
MAGESHIDEAVSTSWGKVISLVEGGHPLSSERTLCFLFAMELWKYFDGELQCDFENQCYQTLQGKSKYLDLLAITPEGKRLAFEFKLPQSSECGNSNQTQTRVAVYRDLARLWWLKTQSVDIGYFLMATNEDAYLNNASLRYYPELLTKHGHSIVAGTAIEVDSITMSQPSCRFSWMGMNGEGPHRRSGRYAWLEPIKV